jgi:hypothetical protein
MQSHRILPLAAMALLTACSSLQYDLSGIPFPISASPLSSPMQGTQRFRLEQKHILWVHGLLGETQPDVKEGLLSNCLPCAGIADFRVTSSSNFWDWLGTHLSLGFVRLKTVTITGERLPPRI